MTQIGLRSGSVHAALGLQKKLDEYIPLSREAVGGKMLHFSNGCLRDG